MIKAFGLDIKKGSNSKINQEFFDNINSEEKAYLLGFFIADGCMQKEEKKKDGKVYSYSYRFALNNSIDDLEIIELFQKSICPNKEIEFTNDQIKIDIPIINLDQIEYNKMKIIYMIFEEENIGLKI